MRLVQRLTRIDQATMHQEYTVYDPDSLTEPWSAEYPLTKARFLRESWTALPAKCNAR